MNRRGKITEYYFKDLDEKDFSLAKGGEDFEYCVRLFLDELELKNLAYNTRRWHRENLYYCHMTLLQLNLSIQPVNITGRCYNFG